MRLRANTPNLLSALRLPMAALFPLVDGVPARVGLVVAAAATDWADGRLARARGQTTAAGAVLDPIADKVFVAAVLATLVLEHDVPLWAVALILLRDIGVVLGSATFALLGRRPPPRARLAGKVVTWLQFAALAVLLVVPGSAPWIAPPIAAAGLFALGDYARSVRDGA